MATKSFGRETTQERNYTAELQNVADAKFPIQVTTQDGKLINVSYETTWLEGGTTPVETTDKDGNAVIEYEENYTDKKLSAAQIKKIDAWIKENIEA